MRRFVKLFRGLDATVGENKTVGGRVVLEIGDDAVLGECAGAVVTSLRLSSSSSSQEIRCR
jgi:hypothetical protein